MWGKRFESTGSKWSLFMRWRFKQWRAPGEGGQHREGAAGVGVESG